MSRRRYRAGGKKWSLSKMHSREGSLFFKTLSAGAQKVWAGTDAKWSRNQMKKMIRKSK